MNTFIEDWHRNATWAVARVQDNPQSKGVPVLLDLAKFCGQMEWAWASLLICQQASDMLVRLGKMETNNEERHKEIMKAIEDYAAKQKAFNTRLEAGIDVAQSALTGLVDDVAALNKKITDLQNSPGQITPEDQALLDGAEADAARITTRMEAFSIALKALDEATPPQLPEQP